MASPRSAGPRRLHPLTLLALLWAAFVVYGTTIPFDFSADPGTVSQGWRELQMSTSRLLHLRRPSWSDVISNLALLAPWSALLAARLRIAGRGFWTTALTAIGTAVALSVGVEYLQIYARSRYASLWDVVLNATGALAGFAVGWGTPAVYRSVAPTLGVLAAKRPLTALSIVVAGFVWLSLLTPFDLSLDVGSLRQAIRLARLVPFGPTIGHETIVDDPLVCGGELVTAALLGGLFSLALREWDWRGSSRILGAGLATAALSVAIETSQLFIVGRRCDLSSSALALVGGMAGSGFVTLHPSWPLERWGGAALKTWAVATLLRSIAPLSFGLPGRTELQRALWIPFLAYFRRLDLVTFSDMTLQVLTFVPMGALLAALKPTRRLGHAAIGGFLVGALLEALQLFNLHRTTDSTDAVLAGVGAAGGFLLWRAGASRARRLVTGRTSHAA